MFYGASELKLDRLEDTKYFDGIDYEIWWIMFKLLCAKFHF